MSREIKFRAWDGDKMTNCGIQFNNTTGMLENKGNIALMQFTGLRDVNGVEIYEGDIVKVNEARAAVVIFKFCGFYVVVKSIYSNREFDTINICDWEEIKVIGNIYEYPHLLDGSK